MTGLRTVELSIVYEHDEGVFFFYPCPINGQLIILAHQGEWEHGFLWENMGKPRGALSLEQLGVSLSEKELVDGHLDVAVYIPISITCPARPGV